jgi:hypothetical protein
MLASLKKKSANGGTLAIRAVQESERGTSIIKPSPLGKSVLLSAESVRSLVGPTVLTQPAFDLRKHTTL